MVALHLHLMKIVAFVMAFWVLALSNMPCADAATINGKETSEVTKNTGSQQHNDADACSPFCHCACCAGFTITHIIVSTLVNPFYNLNPTDSFLHADVVAVALPVWQPPQIV